MANASVVDVSRHENIEGRDCIKKSKNVKLIANIGVLGHLSGRIVDGRNRLDELGLDLSEFNASCPMNTGQGVNFNGYKVPISEILVKRAFLE